MSRIKAFIKDEAVLIISALLAATSAFFVRPSFGYFDYIDFRTLALLFCLMIVMAGLNRMGIFKKLAQKLIKRVKTLWGVALIFCLLCFFSSMIITNDVALITFVPFTIVTLKLVNKGEKLICLVTLETIAANLGSMATPIGNPQNLYLFSAFNMSAGDFLTAILPYALFSLLLIIVSAVLVRAEAITPPAEAEKQGDINFKLLLMYGLLFLSALLTVFRVIPFFIPLALTLALVLLFDRKILLKADYSLLLTFVFLFIFIGNLGNIEPVSKLLHSAVTGNEVIAGVLASQIFSNVPAAILLSGFTQNAKDLLIGVNLGGLGTLIASMASLISYKFVVKEGVKAGRYLATFTMINVIFLALNLALWLLIK